MFELVLIVSLLFSSMLHVEATRDKAQDMKSDVKSSILSVGGLRSRGTGFVARTKSGKRVVITNAHVCEQPIPFMTGRTGDGKEYQLFIAKEYPQHDLCILTSMGPKLPDPLPLADDIYKDERVYIVGHPIMDIMTATDGRLVGYDRARFPAELPLEKCNKPKYKILEVNVNEEDGPPKLQKICFIDVTTIATTAPTDGGASGSPLLNQDSEVVGVVMALVGNISWAQAVPLKDLKAFLNAN